MRLIASGLLASFAVVGFAAADVYQAPTPEPTAEETLILELLNRFRADPVAEADRIAAPGSKPGGWMFNGVDIEMFRTEMKALPPAPPVVFNLQLLDAARKHSHYMILHGLGHAEEEGKPGFTGIGFMQRGKAAGYRGGAGGENCFRDPRDAAYSHAGFLVDSGPGGTGGMQPGRGHRMNMANRVYKEIGPGAVPHDGRLSVTHNFGTRPERFAGGVIYSDLNRNGLYDVGEGRGGVAISASDGATATTWASGAYTLVLKGAGEVTLAAETSGQRFTVSRPAGKDNVKFDWIIPAEADAKLADKLVADVEAIKDSAAPGRFRAVVALVLGSTGLALDAERSARVQSLTAEARPQLEAARTAVRTALGAADRNAPTMVAELGKPYRGTLAEAWFKDAELVARAQQAVAGFTIQAASANPPPQTMTRALVADLKAASEKPGDAYFKAQFDGMLAKVTALSAPTRTR